MHFLLAFFAFAPLMGASQVPEKSTCVQSIEKPAYPGRNWGVEGTVAAKFSIGQDGKIRTAAYESAERLTAEGNNTLKLEVQSAVERTKFVPECSGDYRVTYKFVLNQERSAQPNTTVAFNPPDEFVITANRDVIECSLYAEEKPAWIKQFWSKLRRRGGLPTKKILECY